MAALTRFARTNSAAIRKLGAPGFGIDTPGRRKRQTGAGQAPAPWSEQTELRGSNRGFEPPAKIHVARFGVGRSAKWVTHGNPNWRTRCFNAGPEGRGERRMMARAPTAGIVACHRSSTVHANCDTCGQRPDVIHKPTNSGGASYCQDCCPVCKAAIQPGKGNAPESNQGSCFQSRFTRDVCAKCGEDASPVHLPGGYLGHYCEKCCPVCAGKPVAKGV